MRVATVVLLVLAVTMLSCSRAPSGAKAPRLVVVVVVDQLRPDLLTRYDEAFQGGLRRVLDEGLHYTDALHDHAVTNTAPGHATLGTGAFPSQHGIVDNSWYERRGDGFVSVAAVSDTTTVILGQPDMRGASPHSMRASTLAEWLQESYPEARVVSVGGKDRSAVFLVGGARGCVYWFSREAGRFVTSSWYANEEPDWVQRFHAETWPRFAADTVWANTTPAAYRDLARADDAPFETAREATFPHRFVPPDAPDPVSSEHPGLTSTSPPTADASTSTADAPVRPMSAAQRAYWRWFYGTPFVDAATLTFATVALRAERLGQDDTPDLLAVALAATDVIGHDFGPLSQEQLDNLMHLDRVLGEFFAVLDAEVGAEHWVLALSADHGVGTMPEQLQRDGVKAQRVPREDIELLFTDLQATEAFYAKTRVATSEAELQRILAVRTMATSYVAAAMPRVELAIAGDDEAHSKGAHRDESARRDKPRWAAHDEAPPLRLITSADDPFVRLYRNSYFEGRMLGGPLASREQRRSLGTYGVEVRLGENTNVHRSDAMHGSPYRYDRHVPLVFMVDQVEKTPVKLTILVWQTLT